MYSNIELLNKLNLTTDSEEKYNEIVSYLEGALEYYEQSRTPYRHGKTIDIRELACILVHMKAMVRSDACKEIKPEIIEILQDAVGLNFENGIENKDNYWIFDAWQDLYREHAGLIRAAVKKDISDSEELILCLLLGLSNYVRENQFEVNLEKVCTPLLRQLSQYRATEKYYCSPFFSPFENGISLEEYQKGAYVSLFHVKENTKYKDKLCSIYGEKLIRICGRKKK